MSQNNPRLQWMQQMVFNCFSKGDESAIHAPDKELIQKFLDFIQGKMGKTLLIYYQKPNSNGDKNSDSLQPVYLINEETKNVELQNRACFFIRSCADGKEATSDTDINFGELTSDSIIGMNKVIYNYIYQNIENVDNHEWGKIEPEQKKEFKKVLESFSKDMNDTVDSLVKGVKFQELPPEVRDYIQQDKKDYIRDEEKQQYISKIEEIYQNWIDVLSKEIEDMDKDNPAFSDSGPKS